MMVSGVLMVSGFRGLGIHQQPTPTPSPGWVENRKKPTPRKLTSKPQPAESFTGYP